MKRLILLVSLAVAFLVGYAAAARAWPGVNDRAEWHGYFTNTLDQFGGPVLSGGIPGGVSSANSFISYIEGQLRSGSVQNRTGAAFIIDYMLGSPWRRDNPPNSNDLIIWESAVRAAEARNHISWSTNFSFTVNSYWQGMGAGSNPRDDAFYTETDTQPSIVFRNANGSIAAVIKRSCGNLVTNGNYPGFTDDFTVTGFSSVNNSTPTPGQTVTWTHTLHNIGPAAAPREWWAVFDGSGGQPTGLGSVGTGPIVMAGHETRVVRTENFTVPASARDGTVYCRLVGWDPINSAGSRNGRGAQSCITVHVPLNFTISGTSSVSASTATPGQTVSFTHRLNNSGPNNAPSVSYTIYRNGSNINSGSVSNFSPGTRTVNTNNFTIPNNAAVGSTYCEYVHYAPRNQSGGSGDSTPACVRVISDFNLTPTVTVSATVGQQGDSVSFTYTVHNAGPTSSTSVSCNVVGNVRPPGYTPLPQQDVARTSDPGFSAPSTNCPRIFSAGSTNTVATENVTMGNVPMGSRICRSLVVNPRNQNGGPRTSAETCVIVVKTPYVHFMGNDVWAGGGFSDVNPACNTSAKITTLANTLPDSSIAGSYTEYGAFALGRITQFGSADKALISSGAPTGKMLTFSNTNNSSLGDYGAPQHCINSYISTYSSTPLTTLGSPFDLGSQAASVTSRVNGAHTFHGSVRAGTMQIYLVQGDVTIDGNITYPANYGSLAEVPSLVIIATGNILVRNNVTQMDGVYVAHSTFNTCSNAPAVLSVNDCNQQLIINGAVIAGRVSLMRTYGADGNSSASRKNPAEVFNFVPEVYLRNALNASGTNTVQIVDEKDLPPRY